MGGKKLVSIITDQDLAIRATIEKVFPETRHRLCLWHIRKKFPEKLAHVYHKDILSSVSLKDASETYLVLIFLKKNGST